MKKVLRWAETLDDSLEWREEVNQCYTIKDLDSLILNKIKQTGTLNLFGLLTNSACIADAEYPLDMFV